MRCHGLLASFAVLALFSSGVRAQEVVSAQSGVIHYSEGAVFVDDTPLDRNPAAFPLLKDGSVLRTERGRVELMLTPGTFVRLDENSSVKMLSSALSSTSVEFLKGAAILDALAAEGDIPVVLHYKDAAVSFPKPGLYRVDSDTEVLQAYNGQALVKQGGKETEVDPARLYFFEIGTDTKKFDEGTDDEFLDWARNRNEVINAENQATQAENDDANIDPDAGLAPFSLNSPYGSLNATPGLPGYGSLYPYYGGLFYNGFAPTTLWALPPLPVPAFIIGRRWAYRSLSPSWPHSGTWTPRRLSTSGLGLTAPHPMHLYSPRPLVSRPIVVPHVSVPAVRVGHR